MSTCDCTRMGFVYSFRQLRHLHQQRDSCIPLIIFVTIAAPGYSHAEWTAPLYPKPSEILLEAKADADAGRFQTALEKHVWYHDHALEHDPSESGARLSAALMMWHELAKQYPPALEALKKTRDDVTEQVLQKGDNLRRAFSEMASINKRLGDEDQTVAIFDQLDKESRPVANYLYDLAQAALIKNKRFSLCAKYLEPMDEYGRVLERLGYERDYAQRLELPSDRKYHSELAELGFLESGATLVALLVNVNRNKEADLIARHIRKISKHRNRDAVISAALEGTFVEVEFEGDEERESKGENAPAAISNSAE